MRSVQPVASEPWLPTAPATAVGRAPTSSVETETRRQQASLPSRGEGSALGGPYRESFPPLVPSRSSRTGQTPALWYVAGSATSSGRVIENEVEDVLKRMVEWLSEVRRQAERGLSAVDESSSSDAAAISRLRLVAHLYALHWKVQKIVLNGRSALAQMQSYNEGYIIDLRHLRDELGEQRGRLRDLRGLARRCHAGEILSVHAPPFVPALLLAEDKETNLRVTLLEFERTGEQWEVPPSTLSNASAIGAELRLPGNQSVASANKVLDKIEQSNTALRELLVSHTSLADLAEVPLGRETLSRFADQHPRVIESCSELLSSEDYFHAVFAAVTGMMAHVRELTGSSLDGAKLLHSAFAWGRGGERPALAINALETESQKSEQRGFCSLLLGLYAAFRNPRAHSSAREWAHDDREAVAVLAMVSQVHRRLDQAQRAHPPAEPSL